MNNVLTISRLLIPLHIHTQCADLTSQAMACLLVSQSGNFPTLPHIRRPWTADSCRASGAISWYSHWAVLTWNPKTRNPTVSTSKSSSIIFKFSLIHTQTACLHPDKVVRWYSVVWYLPLLGFETATCHRAPI